MAVVDGVCMRLRIGWRRQVLQTRAELAPWPVEEEVVGAMQAVDLDAIRSVPRHFETAPQHRSHICAVSTKEKR